MKKLLIQFSENLLTRSQMKQLKGGYGEGGCCTVFCYLGTTTLGQADISSCDDAGRYCTQNYPERDSASCSCS